LKFKSKSSTSKMSKRARAVIMSSAVEGIDCTVCRCNLSSDFKIVYQHPILSVAVCANCTEHTNTDCEVGEDGTENQCRWGRVGIFFG
jgi:hypothetical protein